MSLPEGPNKNGGYCECGCGELAPIAEKSHTRSGWVAGLPKRFISGHNCKRWDPQVAEEDHGFATPCWVWQWSRNERGYGVFPDPPVPGRSRLAHRVYFERANGEIPDGLILDHLCRNPPCVNPQHLEAVTYRLNARRGLVTRLTPDQVLEIRASEATQPELAAQYGVARSTISAVQRGETWKDLLNAAT